MRRVGAIVAVLVTAACSDATAPDRAEVTIDPGEVRYQPGEVVVLVLRNLGTRELRFTMCGNLQRFTVTGWADVRRVEPDCPDIAYVLLPGAARSMNGPLLPEKLADGGAYRYRIDALRPASGAPLPERARLSTPFIVATR